MGNADLVTMLVDTLKVFNYGGYRVLKKDKEGNIYEQVIVTLPLTVLSEVEVLLPSMVEEIKAHGVVRPKEGYGCRFTCRNTDTFTMVRELEAQGAKRIIALNLASPVNPGGGVRTGAKAQEEDLCRKSSLLLSLESREAQKYYGYNRFANTYMGTDAMAITPTVQIIKDDRGNLLERPCITSVLTYAAPKLINGRHNMKEKEYRNMVYKRIMTMLTVLAVKGYRNLVLGAWGCGAFGNDSAVISDLFRAAIRNFKYHGYSVDNVFESINFAVLDKTDTQYNFMQFNRNFKG